MTSTSFCRKSSARQAGGKCEEPANGTFNRPDLRTDNKTIMKQENDIPDKILERIRKLIRLKESTTSEGEAKAAATHVNRLLKEYNLSLLDVNEKRSVIRTASATTGSVTCCAYCANTITAGCSVTGEPPTC